MTLPRSFLLRNSVRQAGVAEPKAWYISGVSANGTVVTHPYVYNYSITYTLNAMENLLVYRTTDGTTITSVCAGQRYRVMFPYKPGYSNGTFRWEKKPPGGSWTLIDAESINNYIDVTATYPETEYRARSISEYGWLGDVNSSASFRSTEDSPELIVFPPAPSGVQILAASCGTEEGVEEPFIEVTSIANAAMGAEYRITLGYKNLNLPVPGVAPQFITYTGQSPIATFTGFDNPGDYEVVITAVVNQGEFIANCTRRIRDIELPSFPLPDLTVNTADVLCFGYSNGKIHIGITNAVAPPFLYEILSEDGSLVVASQSSSDRNLDFDLPAGTYQVRFTASSGCSTTLSGFVLEQPAANFPTMELTLRSAVTADDGTIYGVACVNNMALIGVEPSGAYRLR